MKFKPGSEAIDKFQNDTMFRQAETTTRLNFFENYNSKFFDKTLDILLKEVAEALQREIDDSPVKIEPSQFVDRFGKEKRGFLTF